MASELVDAGPDLATVRARYLEAQLHGDRCDALRLVIDEALARGASALDVELEVIQGAQREIGRLWQENNITIATEHMATAISNMALAHLYDHAPRERANGKKVLVACVEGELHDFPALSVTMTFNVPALRSATERVRARSAKTPPIAIGGGACSGMQALAGELHADITARDARELVASARRLLGVSS